MSQALTNFTYVHEDNKSNQTLFLLHGTGADEYDLLPLVAQLDPKPNIVSLRGNIREQGMNRFFARTAPGVFDQESIHQETTKLAAFIEAWQEKYTVSTDQLEFLGFSNGANMIIATMFLYPQLVKKAVALHPMLPFKPANLVLDHHQLLVTYGENDRMITAEQSRALISVLKDSGAQVEVVSHQGGHGIEIVEVVAINTFLN